MPRKRTARKTAAPRVRALRNPAPPSGFDGDVFIQAGHQNTPDDKTGGEGPLGNEIDWTPIVADEATRILRAAGVSTIREDASLKRPERQDERFRVKVAVFLHFDDPDQGETGASIGFKGASDEPAASAWKKLYSKFFPFAFMPDNFTADEANYYGFKFTITTDAEFLIEFGDLGSLRQARWMKPRLKWMGALLAHYLSDRIGKGNVPLPDFPGAVADPHSTEEDDLRDVHVVPSSLPKRLPDYAREKLSAAAGVPWQKAGLLPQFDVYRGLLPGSFCLFHNLTCMPLDGVTTAAIYECKFAIDSDGSSDASDPDHLQQTSLRHPDNSSLDARKDVFGVIPLDAAEARRDGLIKLPGVPDFGGIGLRLGDIGIAFWKGNVAAFVYGDKGPPNAVGEGSIAMAEELGIPADPSNGGFNDKDVHEMNKGVMHIVFPGSSDVRAGSITTKRTRDEVQELGEKLFRAFCRQKA
jgi:Fungal chitosanase of glycosyl hydrolase group 75